MNIGDRFGRWQVVDDTIEFLGRDKSVRCRCDCGTERVVRLPALRSGQTTGCGCGRLAHLERVRPLALAAIQRRVAADYQRGYGRE